MKTLINYRLNLGKLLLVAISLFCFSEKTAAQIDPTLAGMIALYTDQAQSQLENQQKVMALQTTGHIWTKEEIQGTTDLHKEFNDYLDSFRSVLGYAAQIYGFYHEVNCLIGNLDEFSRILSSHPSNSLAVALSQKRGSIYSDVVLHSVEIVNDVRSACLSDHKMTEKERMEIVFAIRPKLKRLNKDIRRLSRAVKYTSLGDIWLDIEENAYTKANKPGITEKARRRWRQIGNTVRP